MGDLLMLIEEARRKREAKKAKPWGMGDRTVDCEP
jgi:hypothetical protein